MKDRSSTGVVITQWRDPETTAVCLGHVASLKLQPRMVVVVDNESESSVLAGQSARFPHVRFLALSTNTGHANAVNIGVRHVYDGGCEYALLLDNDAYVTPECLEILEGALDSQPAAAAASPLILSGRRPGLIWYGGGRISSFGNSIHEYMWKSATEITHSTRPADFVTACTMLVRCAAFDAVGGFDPSLITYSDDLDFSLRLREKDYSLVFVPLARVTHGESVNVIKVAGKPFRDYYTMRNRLVVIWKHGSILQRLLGIPLSIIWYGGVYGVMFTLRGEWRRARGLLQGILDFVLGRSGMRNV
jgi:GT2 family glycosyltransferase